jgi:hypothetical protein
MPRRNMNCDLDRIFTEMRRSLPRDTRSGFVFSTSSFADCPEHIETDRLVVTKSTHGYGSGYRADRIKFHARKETFQELGLLILAVVFRLGGYRTRIVLNHPRSVIKNLVVTYSGLTARSSGQKTRPDHFPSSVGKLEKHPWSWRGQYLDLYSLPSFTLTNMKEFVVSDADWTARDTVMGLGNDDANVRLAELLLNIGYSDETEIVLEGEAGGIRGVGINSAEAVFEVCDDVDDAAGRE